MQATEGAKSRRDLLAGLIFMAIAAGFAYEASKYDMGRAIRMGPGFIPMTLAILLAIFGAMIAFGGLRKDERIEKTPIPWKGIVLILAALVIFGEFGSLLGLVPVVFIGTAIVALASAKNSIVSSLTIAVSMSALCWLVFKVGLGITLPTFGPLLTFS
ncbi:tripartite tricarboxylate transporter TctB family protein [Aureimonas phyllosphaerae]|uniref:Putative tricarboxylic transport membrane protein n=1 Tax=Aureimonas phyllosphaerae TaxID=1166078 RepID=A0A7W6FUZ8_9HYPH|nr:tripartite tricarboxylate transporter TctB family protein [Aureimonas phyllosphaerae]MBB3936633.1 putative tricarboxylic transport membrane protein [Aureimonas phyllosphaerae]MBB3960503.1 putative tricarboxylic transport membrane protein [Aureimonas phyllosphaerae]SFF23901.1 putative tricarboxylic transport membrane protein [Aureimonas phyllosphaerae]